MIVRNPEAESWEIQGQSAYIVVSNLMVEEVDIVRHDYDRVVIRLRATGGYIRLQRSRIFRSEEEANDHRRRPMEKGDHLPSSYDWWYDV